MTSRVRAARLDTESIALAIASAGFVLAGVVGAFVFWGRDVAIAGRGSLGEFTAIAAGIAAGVAFALSRPLSRRIGRGDAARDERYRWFDLIALSVGHAAIALLAWTGIAAVLQRSFQDATLYPSPATVLAGAAVALTAWAAYLSGTGLSPRQLSVVLAIFLVAGMLTAMLSAEDPYWWQMNLSALGISHDISALAFNLTLIVSGVLVTTIARVGTASLPAETSSQRRRRLAVRILFVLLGVLLACVGVFPVDRFFLLHNTVATGMAVAFGALVIGLPWLAPALPKAFITLGFVYVGGIVVLAVLFFLGEYNLTAVELVASVLIFSWIILFLRNVEVLSARTGDDPDHPPAPVTGDLVTAAP